MARGRTLSMKSLTTGRATSASIRALRTSPRAASTSASVRAPRPRSLSKTPLRRDCKDSNKLTTPSGYAPRGAPALLGGDPPRRAGDRKGLWSFRKRGRVLGHKMGKSQTGRQERKGGATAQRGAHRVQPAPIFKEATAMRPALSGLQFQQRIVGRHDHQKRPGPGQDLEQGPGQEKGISRLPPSQRAGKERNDRQACLHHRAALVGGLPLGQGGGIVQHHPGGMFDETDIQRGARKQ